MHNFSAMARGFESKSVESQQADRQAPGQNFDADEKSRQQLERTRRREGVESSLRGVRRELENARSPVHRAALENALHHLEEELRKLT